VIVFDPAYDAYQPAVALAGGKTIHIPLSPPHYTVDWNRVEQAINDKTRLVIINTPHTPTGTVLQSHDLDTLAELIRNRDTLVLSDEVYEHMVFDGDVHQSVLRHPELKRRSFAVFSFGKTYHVTGWKLAYCVAPALLSEEFRKVHQFVTFTSTSFIQYAIADFLAECPQHHLELPDFYQQKRDTFCNLLKQTRFEFTPSRGTYFQLANYSAISNSNDMDFVKYLTQETGVAAIPLSPFYDDPPANHHIRFCFCKDDRTLEAAARKLAKI